MTPVGVRPDEITWPAAGAERAQPLDVEVESVSRSGEVYRVLREPSGALIHTPACAGFRRRGTCRHVLEAIRRTERPLRAFADSLPALVAAAPVEADQSVEDEQELVGWVHLIRIRVDLALEAHRSRERWLTYEARRAGLTPAQRADEAFRRFGG